MSPAPACASAARFAGEGKARVAALSELPANERAEVALDMVACLEHPDPRVRDGFAYETYAAIMRGGLLDETGLRALKAALLDELAAAGGDPAGFRGPFAALILSEVVRTDRITPWMTGEERGELVAAAAAYMSGLADYRGYSDTDGWRHGVAHTADIFLQLSLNEALTRDEADAILAVIAVKAGTSDHAYIFGEPERLAAPVLYLSRRGLLTPEEWTDWFMGLWPEDDPLREVAYASAAALARKHNLTAFAESVYVSADVSGDEAFAPVGAASLAFIRSLP
ncbi:DUF2785 domain-containing protein [Hyphomonas sp.]|uniref:DUF2785 domain-containing protein n=1 Tax=Hyphomonas sp. TaxID=87 RepID=UPI003527C87F